MNKICDSRLAGASVFSRSDTSFGFVPTALLFGLGCLGLLSIPTSLVAQEAAKEKASIGSTVKKPVPPLQIVISKGLPWLCPEAYWGAECGTLGDLHNDALAAALGATPPRPPQQLTVAEFITLLQKWTPKMRQLDAVIHNKEDMAKLTSQLTERLRAAGMVDANGHAVRDAFGDPSKFLGYLEANGQISRTLETTVRQLLAKNVSVAEFAKALSDGRWSGNDVTGLRSLEGDDHAPHPC